MELLSNKGTQFDPQVVDAFLSVLVGNGTSLLKNSAVETNGFVRANEILNPLPNQA
jgi:HD-GYP domain-containing protein (c-di-GMP phosphodiesterase class II)